MAAGAPPGEIVGRCSDLEKRCPPAGFGPASAYCAGPTGPVGCSSAIRLENPAIHHLSRKMRATRGWRGSLGRKLGFRANMPVAGQVERASQPNNAAPAVFEESRPGRARTEAPNAGMRGYGRDLEEIGAGKVGQLLPWLSPALPNHSGAFRPEVSSLPRKPSIPPQQVSPRRATRAMLGRNSATGGRWRDTRRNPNPRYRVIGEGASEAQAFRGRSQKRLGRQPARIGKPSLSALGQARRPNAQQGPRNTGGQPSKVARGREQRRRQFRAGG